MSSGKNFIFTTIFQETMQIDPNYVFEFKRQIFDSYRNMSLDMFAESFCESVEEINLQKTMYLLSETLEDFNKITDSYSDDNAGFELTDFISDYFNCYNKLNEGALNRLAYIGQQSLETSNLFLIKKYTPIALHTIAQKDLKNNDLRLPEEYNIVDFLKSVNELKHLDKAKKITSIKSLAIRADYSADKLYEKYDLSWPLGTTGKFVAKHHEYIQDILN